MTTACPHCDQTTSHRIEKYCPQCDKTLPHTSFHKNRSAPDGLSAWCKACRKHKRNEPTNKEAYNAYMRTWNGRNREKVNANAVEHYWDLKERRQADPELDEHVKQLQRAKNARYAERHPDRVATSSHNYAQANKPKINKRRRERNVEHP